MKQIWELAFFTAILLAGAVQADRYVWTGGSPDGTYSSWATAATNIQDAVNKAAAGETVWVTNGTYAITNQIVVTNGIFVRSFNNDPASTIVTRASGTCRLFFVSNAAAFVSGFTITNGAPASTEGGGGVLLWAGTVSNCVIVKNNTGTQMGGGGIYMATNTLLVDSVVRANATAKDISGMGIRLNGGTVRNCRISENVSTSARKTYGGGVSLTGGLVENCVIFGNSITDSGGGVLLAGGTVRGCLIYSNLTVFSGKPYGRGGGVFVTTGGGTIENCTIVANTARNGGGVCGQAGTPVTYAVVTNSILWLNQAGSGEGNPNYDGALFTRSCTTPLTTAGALQATTFGEGNRFDDPGFVDPAALNFRLRPGSPTLNSGTNLAWMTGARDLDGRARILSPGGTSDMGAYEYEAGPLLGYFSADVTTGLDSTTVIFTASADGTNLAGVAYTWDFDNNGSSDATGPVATNTYSAGLYSVKLTVDNTIGESSAFLRQKYIRIAPLTPICVSTNGSATPPYDTWARGLTTIEDALALAATGSVIAATNGTYAISGQITLGTPVTLLGVNGPASTILQGPGVGRILYITNGAATVDGFTLKNGVGQDFDVAASDGGGLYVTTGLVRNCYITANTGPTRKAGVGVFMTGGVIRDSQLFANTGGTDGKGGGVYMTGGLLERCAFFGNTLPGASSQGGGVYASGGRVVNCVVCSNTINASSTSQGGGLYLTGPAVAIGCLVFSNTVLSSGTGNVQGGGIFGGVAMSCTVVSNYAKVTGGGTHNTSLTNSIVAFNASGVSNNWSGGSLAYSCTTPTNGLAGAGNTDADPLFANAAAKNYRLTATSPCFNKGLYQNWMDGAVDLDGNARIAGGQVDMGAYELSTRVKGTIVVIR